MPPRRLSVPLLCSTSIALLLSVAIPSASAQQTSPAASLTFRNIGPAALGGRIHDVEAVSGNPSIVWIASASGGIWKSTNHATTWTPVFDQVGMNTFGDLEIFPGDPDVVWAGTGEQNNRQSSSWGNGVYRTVDGGKTWTHLGLEATHHIGRVRVHPTNRDVAYVAALGNLWKPSRERGVFKTTDGGKTWQHVLVVDTLTGAVDLVMDPSDPNTLYAAAYQRMRASWGFNGGGPGSGIYKTTDGGTTWRKLTNGVPPGDLGRIGLAIAKTNPRILNATIEHATESGTYRSEDGGETWTRMSRTNPRPMYYSHIFIDPTNDQRVWILAEPILKSEDGGRTFRRMPYSPTYDVGLHSDFHSMWIDPANPRHFYIAGDGGLGESWDMGETYSAIKNIPIGQFYAIGVDNRDPYWVYGGMQDNHSWMGPSATRHWLGIVNYDWRQIGFGDGMMQQPDQFDPRIVFTSGQSGSVTRFDIETGDRLDIRPEPAPGDTAYRFDWTAPMLASRHTPGTFYLGGNRLFITRDRGVTWTRTKDLTRQVNRDTLRIMGVLGRDIRLSRNDGESSFSELTSIAESPLDPKILWVGADDGTVQVSRDGGVTWEDVSAGIGAPSGLLVSRVVASSAGRGVAYVTIDGHRSGDFAPYIFRTNDFGRTWSKVTNGVGAGESVRSLAEYPGAAGVVLAGTERALYLSLDTARTWQRFGGGLPTTRYDDVLFHPRTKDIVIGTHGRSFWILDDASPLSTLSAAIAAARPRIFPTRQATTFQYWQDYSYLGAGAYAAPNPADGALVTYYLPAPVNSAQLVVVAPDGRLVRTLAAPSGAGVQRVNWDLRNEPPFSEPDTSEASRLSLPRPTHELRDRGPFVSPGTYTVRLEAEEGRVLAQGTVSVVADPKLPITLAQHRERERFLLEVLNLQREVVALSDEITKLRPAAGPAVTGPQPAPTDDRTSRLAALDRRVRMGPGALRGRIYGLANDFNGNEAQQGSFYPPTALQRATLADVKGALAKAKEELAALR